MYAWYVLQTSDLWPGREQSMEMDVESRGRLAALESASLAGLDTVVSPVQEIDATVYRCQL